MDDRIWLRHPEHGGYFHCPVDAVQDWKGLGWQESDPPPPPVSPVVAERITWEAEQARLVEQANQAAAAEADKANIKPARRGDSPGVKDG